MSTDTFQSIGTSASPMDRQIFGAAVVSQTLDTLNNVGGGQSSAPVDKESFGGAVVSKTLDYMNSGGTNSSYGADGGMSQTYGLAKDVLGAYMTGRGAIADIKA